MPLVGEESVQWAVSDDNGKLTTSIEYSTLSEVAPQVEGRRVTLVLPADDVLLAEATVPGGSLARSVFADGCAGIGELSQTVSRV